jgi:hypothetical protein
MPSTPSIFSPVTLSRTWLDVFDALDQWEDVSNFYGLHSRELNTVQGHRRLCSPKVGHLVALRTGSVQLVHHIHQEDVDDFHGSDEGELWALTGAGGTASMLVIGTRCAYDRLTGDAISWETMMTWTSKKDVTTAPGNATTKTPNVKGKSPAASKKKSPASETRSRRSTTAMTQKMKAYKQTLAPEDSDEEEGDDEVKVVRINDENVDPAGAQTLDESTVVPNLLPIPAFLVAALMRTYASDAATLCLAAINAIKDRAEKAGEDPALSQNAKRAAYVAAWLWNVARRDRNGRLKCVQIGPVANPRADEWSRKCHLKYLADRAAPAGQPAIDATSEVWTNLANALALQATDRAGANATTTASKKQGFEAFPLATQRLILTASEREEDGQVRSQPLPTYVEILELGNAAYVGQHFQIHLNEGLGLDVMLPTGFCSAVRMAAFISVMKDRPEAFSLFSCGPQPLVGTTITTADDDSAGHDDIMRMQLKIADSTTGLSDKDVKKLTVVKHTIPKDFEDLSKLLENFAGVTGLVFGTASPITSMLRGWVRFLTKSGGSQVSNLRQLAFTDASAPSRVGWFIERRLQQFLTACASADHADLVDLELFDFSQARQQLRDGAFVYPLCPFLKAKLNPGTSGSQQSRASGSQKAAAGRSGYPEDVVINPAGRGAKLSSKDHWQTFIDHASEAPLPGLCCRYHLNGQCKRGCYYGDTHVQLTAEQKTALGPWVAKCRARMPSTGGTSDANKKQKLVGNRDQAYPTSHLLATLDALRRPPAPAVDYRTQLSGSRLGPRQPPTLTVPLTKPPARAVVALPTAPPATSVSTTRFLADSRPSTASAVSTASPTARSSLTTAIAVSPTRPPSTAVAVSPARPPATAPVGAQFPHLTPTSVPCPVSPQPPQCKSAPTVPVPRLLSIDARFPLLPLGRLPNLLSAILHLPPRRTHPIAFRFEWSDDAARHNMSILRKFNLDLAAAVAAQPFSTITPGSEFRPASLLAPLLSRHPLWPRFRERITVGAEFPLSPISDADRRTDLHTILARGNHKSARGHEAKLAIMLKEEVSRGWQLPLPKEAALELPGCEVAPLGVVSQWTIDESGSRKPKLRLTHDQSFNPTKGERRSVNDRVITAELTPARFGRALMRLLHYVCLLRRRFPGERLLLTKVDCKSAYRRIHLRATTALKACTVFAGMLLVALRLTFGGAPNPSQWSDVSEVAVDLANDLVRRDDWEPAEWSAPQQHLLDSDKAVDCDAGTVGDDDSFGEAAEMSVVYPVEDARPIFDCYLDDLFGVSREADRARLEAVIPFVLHLLSRPVEAGSAESLPRDNLIAISKFLAEAKASESKVILGWVVNTRSMTVSLPIDKHRVWVAEIRELRTRPGRRATAKELESTIGRLSHAAYVVPNSRHFLGRLYRASERAKVHGSVNLSQSQWDDLGIWETFLESALKGVSINRLVARWPNRIVRVDACPQGMGGYGLQSGVAWRILLEPDLIGRGSLNSLEFLAALIGIWVEHEFGGSLEPEDVLLCQGDSSSATGWISKSSFGDECPLQLAIARTMAEYLNANEISHYSQWFPGKENSVADSLSRDFHLDDDEIDAHVRAQFAPQIPRSFRLVRLTAAMTSSVGSLLRLLPRTQQLPREPVPSATAAGGGTTSSSKRSVTSAIRSSAASESGNASKSFRASPLLCAKAGHATPEELKSLALDDKRAQFVPPSTAWRRPFGLTNLAAQSTIIEDDSTPFWQPS